MLRMDFVGVTNTFLFFVQNFITLFFFDVSLLEFFLLLLIASDIVRGDKGEVKVKQVN
jgi:hypothetical protein